MKNNLLVILLMLGVCFSAYSQQTKTPEPEIEMRVIRQVIYKVSVFYPYAEGKTFDMDYYEKSHMPYVAGLLGSNLVRYTIEKGVASGVPNTPLPFMAIGSFYVTSISEYNAAIVPNIEAIRADFPKYTNITPIVQISEVVR